MKTAQEKTGRMHLMEGRIKDSGPKVKVFVAADHHRPWWIGGNLFKRWRMPASYRLLPSNGGNKRAIHIQSCDARAACRREADEALVLPPEMQPPGIQAGMKQRRHFAGLGIESLNPRPFAQRA